VKPVWLFRVFDAFHVRGNGWVLLPGARREDPAKVAVGDSIELRGGKGPARKAVVKGVGVFAATEDAMPLLVELEPTDMPQIINAEVWVVGKG
jgi:hypothetical protein